jgi:hypothetical protein
LAAAGELPGAIGACTDAERRRTTELAKQLEAAGRRTRTVTLWVRPAWWAVQALCATAGVLASVAAIGRPGLAFGIAVAALLLSLADVAGTSPLRRLTPARATQNLVSTAPERRGSRPVTLIISAAIDDPRRALAQRLPVRLGAVVVCSLALVAAALLVRVLTFDPARWLDFAQLLPTLVLLCTLPLLLEEGLGELQPGGSVAGAALELVAALDAEPPRNLDVAVLLAGAGAPQAAGLRAWLRQRRRRGLQRSDVAILHLEPVDEDAAVWWERDGPLWGTALHPQLVAAARAAGERTPGAHSTHTSRPTAAGIARTDGWPAIAVGPHPDLARALVRELDSALSGGVGAAGGRP